MAKIIREKYEGGVLVARETEVDGKDGMEIIKICLLLIIAISVTVLTVVSIRDSVMMQNMVNPSEMMDTACPAPTIRS